MTPLELARQALEQWSAATPGPWRVTCSSGLTSLVETPADILVVRALYQDAPAIAAARTREPQLATFLINLHDMIKRSVDDVRAARDAEQGGDRAVEYLEMLLRVIE